MNGSGIYTKDRRQRGKRVQSSSFGVKSLRAVVVPPGLSSHDSYMHGGHGALSGLEVTQAWSAGLTLGSFLSPVSEVPGI